jgi:hypothetical protein
MNDDPRPAPRPPEGGDDSFGTAPEVSGSPQPAPRPPAPAGGRKVGLLMGVLVVVVVAVVAIVGFVTR